MRTAEEFWAKTMPCPPTDCLLWIAGSFSNGYGCAEWDGKAQKAHRVAFFLTHGYWPHVCRHTCDTPPCVNPAHLLDGTNADNAHDAVARGRMASGDRNGSRAHIERRPRGDYHAFRQRPSIVPRGERNGNSLYTAKQIIEWRRLWTSGQWKSKSQLARDLRCGRAQLSRALRGVAWRHVP